MDFAWDIDNVINDDPVVEGSGAGGKGGGSASQGQEAPNTLRSKAIARFLFLLGEGVIKQIVGDDKGIIVNKVPVRNPDESLNHKGIQWWFKEGLSDQAAIPGFEQVSSEFGVQLRVRQDTPVIYRTQADDLDAVIVTLAIPALTKLNKDKGSIEGYWTKVAVDYRTLAGDWVTPVIEDYISGKNTSPYERSYRIDLEGTGPWLIRMRRPTPDSDEDSSITDETYFSHVTEIRDYKVGYSDSAVVGIEIDTELLGDSGDIRFDIDGKLINYPSNYNPETREYTGFWNGTWSFGFCDDPAWVFMDVCMNPRYGLGIPLALLDKWGLYQLSRYCNEMVPDGEGGMEPRFTFNGTFYNQEDAYKVLQSIASLMRAIVFYSAGAVMVRQDAPAAPEQRIYTPANVVGDFSYSSTAKSVRHNACTVQWVNPELGYENDYAVYEDRENILKYGYNNLSIKAIGTTRRGQAYRQAKWAVLTELLQTDTVVFEAGRDSSTVLPGDIIEVADPHWATADFGGRLIQDGSINGVTELKLDRPIEWDGATNPSIHLTLLAGPIDDVDDVDNADRPNKREIRYFASNILDYDPVDNVITLETPVPDDGNDELTPLIWIYSRDEVAPRAYRVISIEETDDRTFTLTGLQYSVEKFERMDENFIINYDPGANYSNLPQTAFCTPPTNLRVEIINKVSGTSLSQSVIASWRASVDPFVYGYLVSYKVDDENWTTLPVVFDTMVEIQDARLGNYIFKVRAINRFSVPSAEIFDGISVSENSATDQEPVYDAGTDTNNVTFIDRDIHLQWTSNALSQALATPSIGVGVTRPPLDVTTAGGALNVVAGAPDPSNAAGVANVANVQAPVFTFSGTFAIGDEAIIRVGNRRFRHLNETGGTITPTAVANALKTKIDAEAGFAAAVAPGVGGAPASVTITYDNTVSNAADQSAHNDPMFKRYVIEVRDPVSNTLKRTLYSQTNNLIYTYVQNTADFVTPSRSVKFKISVEDINGNLSQQYTTTFTNPAPVPVTVTAEAQPGVLRLKYAPPSDADFAGIVVYMSTVNGFTPGSGNQVYKDRGSPAIPVDPNTTYYYRYGFFDLFGDTGIALSAQQSITIPGIGTEDLDTTPPGLPTGLTLTSSLSLDTDSSQTVLLRATWTPPADTDLSGYVLAIKEASGSFVEFQVGPTSTTYEVRVIANTLYTAKIKSFDHLGNFSAFTSNVTHATTADTTAPSAPTALAATAAVQNIFLSWTNPSANDLTEIEIWENSVNNSGTATRIATVNALPSTEGRFTRSGLATNTSKFYWIKAVDSSGNRSAFSSVASATTAYVANADILAGTVNADRILAGTITGNLFNTGTSLPGTITVGVTGVSIGTVQTQAADPVARANVLTTTLLPGLVQISGATTLSDWRQGGDLTKIAGGQISANTILANSVIVGLRGIDMAGLEFTANWNGSATTTNRLYWSAGVVSYIDNSGTATTANISSSFVDWTTGTVYVYWVQGGTTLSTTTSAATAYGANNVVLAVYRGGTDLIANYGRTIIDGSQITTGSLTVDKIKSGEIFAQTYYVGGTTFALKGDAQGAGKGAIWITAGAGLSGVKLMEMGYLDASTIGFRIRNAAGNVIVDTTYAPIASGAGTTIVLTALGTNAPTVAGNSIIKTAATTARDSAVRGVALAGACYVRRKTPASGNCELALATETYKNSMLRDDHAAYVEYDGNYYLYVAGVGYTGQSYFASSSADVVLLYDGFKYRVFIDGVQRLLYAAPEGQTLYPKWFAMSQGTYTDLMADYAYDRSWGNLGGIGLPASNATADLVLSGIGTAANVIVGNTYKKTNSGSAHTGGAVVSNPITGAQFVEADILAGGVNNQIALDNNATDYTPGVNILAYANYNATTGGYSWGTDGAITTAGTTAGLTGKIRIEYDGLYFRLYIGGNLVGTPIAASAPDLKLWAKWPLYDANILFTGANNGAMNNAAWTIINGAGKPSDNAGTTLALTKFSSTNLTITGNKVTQTATGNWNAFWSEQVFPNAAVASWRVSATTYASGSLKPTKPSSDGDQGGTFTILTTGSNIYYYNGVGTPILAAGTPAAGDTYTIVIDNVTVFYYRTTSAGVTTLLGTITATANQTYRFVGQVYVDAMSDIMAMPGADNLWANTGGENRPANDATSSYNMVKNGGAENGDTSFWIKNEGDMASVFTVNGANKRSGTYAFSLTKPTSTANTIDVISRAMQVVPGETYVIRGWFKGDTAQASGFYFGINEKATAPIDGNYIPAAERSNRTDVVGNGPLTTTYAEKSMLYTVPAGVYWVSLAIYSWTGGPLTVYFDDIQFFKVIGLGGDVNGILSSSYNVPNILTANLAYKYTGTVSYTSAAGTPATATISVTAGSLQSGANSTSYNAMSVGVSGTGGTVVQYYLYVDDPTRIGGAQTLIATTTPLNIYSATGRIYIGDCTVTFPTSGTGGGGGGGGGGYCIWANALVPTRNRGEVRAVEINADDTIMVLTPDRNGVQWGRVEGNELAWEECFDIVSNETGVVVTVSESTPITLRNGNVIRVSEVHGHELPIMVDGVFSWERCRVTYIGKRQVAKIKCYQRTYAGGNVSGRYILTHNPKP